MIIIKAIEFPDLEFSSKEELFAALKENKAHIIDLKKADLKSSDSLKMTAIKFDSEVGKAHGFEDGFIYPVINTTKYMDSHRDVHLNGIWTKSIDEQQGKVYYLANHQLEVGKVIAYPKDVEMFTKTMTWKSLGASYSGSTQALMFKVSKDKVRMQDAKDIINEKIDIEHSVRMRYVKIDLAVNSEEDDFKAEKAIFDKHINSIANKEVAESAGYFWAVGEAQVHKEGSMVLAGSNDVTPMMQNKDIEPSKDTQETEPPTSTHKSNKFKHLL